jgi:hypothetical protein
MTAQRFTLSLKAEDRVIEQRVVDIAEAGNLTELPLRVDRLGRDLLHRLETRERSASLPHNRSMQDYLRQHDIVYRQPSPGWDEGLPLGNGDMGALVTGREGKEQNFHLDKTDIWLATAEGKPLGRSYAGVLNVRYNREQRSDPFLQRLSLGRAEVSTQDGSFQSRARVHALRNRFEVEISASEVEVSLERQTVPLWDNRASRLYGSWASLSSTQDLEQIRKAVRHAPHTKLEWGQESGQCWFTHTAPNLSYTLLVTVADAEIHWKRVDNGFRGRVRASGKKPIRLLATLATSREAPSPLARARQLIAGDGPESHHEWWQRFWTRSWIELPDKLEENLWYMGVYQQAVCSRSDQAVSFFGLWHPLDLRGWYDGYVTDAQVEMMWWQSFATNHLELLYPSHRTFGRFAVESVEHTPGPGMVVPHLFTPEWAGGHQFFTGTNPYKGSVAWYTMNFWWDYLYSGDHEFLRDVTYPLLRMVADFFVADLVLEADQRYHCVKSGSPEQSNTARDNIYDWALLNYLFRASIRASEVLGVDRQLRTQWNGILAALFEPPGDKETLWETADLPHPYRCHPVVLFGLYPTNAIAHGSPLFEKTRRTLEPVTRLIGYRYQDRHETIPSFAGGMESNGFSSGIVTTTAARLGDREQYRRFLYGLVVRFHMKQNGLRALLDTRQSSEISRASLVEAASAQTVAISETLVQSWDDHVRLFPCIDEQGRYRFAGLRAAGGFILSGEANEGRLLWAQVKSLNGGTLRLSSPILGDVILRERGTGRPAVFKWVRTEQKERSLELECQAGATYEMLANENVRVDLDLSPAALRTQPRAVSIAAVERLGGPFVHYPENLPFGQVVVDENLYLGKPASYGLPSAPPRLQDLLVQAESRTWQERQEAARLMARLQPTSELLQALDRLCADSVNVVAHTAAVTLVHLGTPEALALAQTHAEKDAIPGLKREVEKARQRPR